MKEAAVAVVSWSFSTLLFLRLKMEARSLESAPRFKLDGDSPAISYAVTVMITASSSSSELSTGLLSCTTGAFAAVGVFLLLLRPSSVLVSSLPRLRVGDCPSSWAAETAREPGVKSSSSLAPCMELKSMLLPLVVLVPASDTSDLKSDGCCSESMGSSFKTPLRTMRSSSSADSCKLFPVIAEYVATTPKTAVLVMAPIFINRPNIEKSCSSPCS
mmetsp:Transcript_2572/g.8495  ORF Transcript_2572/g.8495 Transcript_2572/m.8495 type:complete len:216 (-) Transcript_2572:35-682(-)